MSLKKTTVRGVGWSATSQIARLLMQILISAILARLLEPSDFGLIAMVTVFSNFVAIFSGFGLASAIVREREISDEALSSTFWISQHDKQVVREAYITANRYIGAVSFPLMIWVLVTAPQLIRVLYGPKWISAIPLVQILALTAAAQSISVTLGWILLSQGRTDVLLKLGIFTTIVVAISFAVGLRWGVLGVAIAYTIATL